MMSSEFPTFSPTLEVRRLAETADPLVRYIPKESDLKLLPSRIFRRNSDWEQTTHATDASHAETNLLSLNRKRESSLPAFHVDLVFGKEDRFVSLQKWEGHVVEVQENTFSTRLIDLTTQAAEEDAVFSVRQVSAEDLPLITPGAVLYWNIGYHTDFTGRQRTVSELRFRRLPPLAENEIVAARREGKEIYEWLSGKSA